MTKAITFLGVKPIETVYVMPTGDHCSAPFVGVALAQVYEKLDMRVFVTAKAYEDQYGRFEALVKNYVTSVEPVEIPDGKGPEELWLIFDKVVGAVTQQEQVIFDITHGFRSLPFLSFLAAAYLRTVKQINLESVLYGNFEASQGGLTPVIDLSAFVSLLDWMMAADRFIQTGDARKLADLLVSPTTVSGPAADAAHALSTTSLAAFLCQPRHLLPQAHALREQLQAAEVQLHAEVKPFQLVQDRIVNGFGAFGAAKDADDREVLRAQFRLIQWYHGNNQLIQAMTLAREWLVSAVTVRLGLPLDPSLTDRNSIEKNLGDLRQLAQTPAASGGQTPGGAGTLKQYTLIMYDTWADWRELVRLRKQVGDIRNALDHAGYQAQPMPMEQIVSDIDQVVMPNLCALAADWGFWESEDAAA